MNSKPPRNFESAEFQTIDPWKSEYLAVRGRNLPHLTVPGATYFITFRAKTELSPAARDAVFAAIVGCNQKSIDLEAAVVMPDHVHLILRLIEPCELPQVLQRIKGGSAHRINQILNSQGSVWTDESFDHVIRRAEELAEKTEYIRQNPVKRGFADRPQGYRWIFTKNLTG
jgi:REP-associated tyrosine transposase